MTFLITQILTGLYEEITFVRHVSFTISDHSYVQVPLQLKA